MRDRKPYDLKYFVIAYNLFQTFFSLWGFVQGWRWDRNFLCLLFDKSIFFSFYVSGNYSWQCEPVDYSNSPTALRALHMAWIFYFSKIIDMVDSIIFLLKKKYTHLSFLHVFHHGIMPFYTWWGPRWVNRIATKIIEDFDTFWTPSPSRKDFFWGISKNLWGIKA